MIGRELDRNRVDWKSVRLEECKIGHWKRVRLEQSSLEECKIGRV